MKPSSLSLPYADFRPGQLEAIEAIVSSDARVIFYEGPVGSGKSGVAEGVLNYLGETGAILTTDLGLQEQYTETFEELVDMRGRSHFDCIVHEGKLATEGHCVMRQPCHEAYGPDNRLGKCPYYVQMWNALESDRYVTNYAMFMALAKLGKPVDRPFVFCDEAHRLEGSLLDAGTIEVSDHACDIVKVPYPPDDWDELYEWAQAYTGKIDEALEKLDKGRKAKLEALTNLCDLLNDLGPEEGATDSRSAWVLYRSEKLLSVRPLFADNLFRSRILSHAGRVVLMSGTIPEPRYFARILGLQEGEWEYIKSPMHFPKGRRPVHIVASVKVSAKNPESYREVVGAVDEFIQTHRAKGLLHTGNYALAHVLEKYSDYKANIIFYDTKTRRQAIAKFKAASPPCYLAGPSLTEGLDLPYEHVSQQLLLKMPIPNLMDPWVQARRKVDKEWDGFTTASAVAQAYGRGVRSADDYSEFHIIDANFKWHFGRFKQHYPQWFKEALIWE